MKTCFRCGESKSVDEFYRHPAMADGRLGKCKACTRSDVRLNREARADQYRAYEQGRSRDPERRAARAAYSRTGAGAGAHRRARRDWIERNPEKRAAHVAVGNAVRDGRLVRLGCEVCGSERSEAHHDDYTKPLDVRWLCRRHHADAHYGAA